ncbi:MAG: DUF4200 domain-containing protein [Alphaproteobacteria bacterium]
MPDPTWIELFDGYNLRFNNGVQPPAYILQKTMENVDGKGRMITINVTDLDEQAYRKIIDTLKYKEGLDLQGKLGKHPKGYYGVPTEIFQQAMLEKIPDNIALRGPSGQTVYIMKKGYNPDVTQGSGYYYTLTDDQGQSVKNLSEADKRFYESAISRQIKSNYGYDIKIDLENTNNRFRMPATNFNSQWAQQKMLAPPAILDVYHPNTGFTLQRNGPVYQLMQGGRPYQGELPMGIKEFISTKYGMDIEITQRSAFNSKAWVVPSDTMNQAWRYMDNAPSTRPFILSDDGTSLQFKKYGDGRVLYVLVDKNGTSLESLTSQRINQLSRSALERHNLNISFEEFKFGSSTRYGVDIPTMAAQIENRGLQLRLTNDYGLRLSDTGGRRMFIVDAAGNPVDMLKPGARIEDLQSIARNKYPNLGKIEFEKFKWGENTFLGVAIDKPPSAPDIPPSQTSSPIVEDVSSEVWDGEKWVKVEAPANTPKMNPKITPQNSTGNIVEEVKVKEPIINQTPVIDYEQNPTSGYQVTIEEADAGKSRNFVITDRKTGGVPQERIPDEILKKLNSDAIELMRKENLPVNENFKFPKVQPTVEGYNYNIKISLEPSSIPKSTTGSAPVVIQNLDPNNNFLPNSITEFSDNVRTDYKVKLSDTNGLRLVEIIDGNQPVKTNISKEGFAYLEDMAKREMQNQWGEIPDKFSLNGQNLQNQKYGYVYTKPVVQAELPKSYNLGGGYSLELRSGADGKDRYFPFKNGEKISMSLPGGGDDLATMEKILKQNKIVMRNGIPQGLAWSPTQGPVIPVDDFRGYYNAQPKIDGIIQPEHYYVKDNVWLTRESPDGKPRYFVYEGGLKRNNLMTMMPSLENSEFSKFTGQWMDSPTQGTYFSPSQTLEYNNKIIETIKPSSNRHSFRAPNSFDSSGSNKWAGQRGFVANPLNDGGQWQNPFKRPDFQKLNIFDNTATLQSGANTVNSVRQGLSGLSGWQNNSLNRAFNTNSSFGSSTTSVFSTQYQFGQQRYFERVGGLIAELPPGGFTNPNSILNPQTQSFSNKLRAGFANLMESTDNFVSGEKAVMDMVDNTPIFRPENALRNNPFRTSANPFSGLQNIENPNGLQRTGQRIAQSFNNVADTFGDVSRTMSESRLFTNPYMQYTGRVFNGTGKILGGVLNSPVTRTAGNVTGVYMAGNEIANQFGYQITLSERYIPTVAPSTNTIATGGRGNAVMDGSSYGAGAALGTLNVISAIPKVALIAQPLKLALELVGVEGTDATFMNGMDFVNKGQTKQAAENFSSWAKNIARNPLVSMGISYPDDMNGRERLGAFVGKAAAMYPHLGQGGLLTFFNSGDPNSKDMISRIFNGSIAEGDWEKTINQFMLKAPIASYRDGFIAYAQANSNNWIRQNFAVPGAANRFYPSGDFPFTIPGAPQLKTVELLQKYEADFTERAKSSFDLIQNTLSQNGSLLTKPLTKAEEEELRQNRIENNLKNVKEIVYGTSGEGVRTFTNVNGQQSISAKSRIEEADKNLKAEYVRLFGDKVSEGIIGGVGGEEMQKVTKDLQEKENEYKEYNEYLEKEKPAKLEEAKQYLATCEANLKQYEQFLNDNPNAPEATRKTALQKMEELQKSKVEWTDYKNWWVSQYSKDFEMYRNARVEEIEKYVANQSLSYSRYFDREMQTLQQSLNGNKIVDKDTEALIIAAPTVDINQYFSDGAPVNVLQSYNQNVPAQPQNQTKPVAAHVPQPK